MLVGAFNELAPQPVHTGMAALLSVLVLLAMLLATIGVIIGCKWVLSARSAVFMLLLYVVFMMQAILLSEHYVGG